MELHSKRLHCINPALEIVDKIIEGSSGIADYLKLQIPQEWDEFETGPFEYVRE